MILVRFPRKAVLLAAFSLVLVQGCGLLPGIIVTSYITGAPKLWEDLPSDIKAEAERGEFDLPMHEVFEAATGVLIDRNIPIGACIESQGLIKSEAYLVAPGTTAVETVSMGEEKGVTYVRWRTDMSSSESQKNDAENTTDARMETARSRYRLLFEKLRANEKTSLEKRRAAIHIE